jgi:hypothetical protein
LERALEEFDGSWIITDKQNRAERGTRERDRT